MLLVLRLFMIHVLVLGLCMPSCILYKTTTAAQTLNCFMPAQEFHRFQQPFWTGGTRECTRQGAVLVPFVAQIQIVCTFEDGLF
eukprot:1735684-Amphidinium_carterae.1